MARPAITKGDVVRLVKGALEGGLPPGSFELRQEGGVLRLLPCNPVEPQDAAEPNTWDRFITPAA